MVQIKQIYNLLKEGKCPSQISKELNLSKQRIQYYIKIMRNKGIIQKEGYGVWSIKAELKEIDEDIPITNLHALQINFPILEGTIKDSDWNIKEKLNNWLPKYKNLNILGGLTLKNNNNKSLTVFAETRNITDLNEVDNLAFKIRSYIFDYFKNKHSVILDVMNCQVKNLNLATEDKHSEGMIRKGEKMELDLNKKSEKIFDQDNINAKAWIDGSPFKFSAETNDKEWKRAYLNMPFTILGLANCFPAIQEYNKNILLHMEVQQAQLINNQEGLKTQQRIQALLEKLGDKLK